MSTFSPPSRSRDARPLESRVLFLRLLEEGLVLAVAFFFELLGRAKTERGRVHAVALPGRRRTVVEDVAQVRIRVHGADFVSGNAQAKVPPGLDVGFLERSGEARPARAGIVLVERREERLARDDIQIDARPVVVPVFVREGALGPLLLRDVVLEGRQLLAELGVRRFLEVAVPAPRFRRALAVDRQGQRQGDESGGNRGVRHFLPPAVSPQICFNRASRPHPWWYSSAG